MDEQTSTEQPDTDAAETAAPSYDEPGDYVYVGEDDRTYETRSLEVKRGDTHHWPDGAPDYRWEPEDTEAAQAALAERAEREVADAAEADEPEDTEAAQAALAERAEREVADAAEADEPETESGEEVPAGATVDGSVKQINDYLDGLKADNADLYLQERDRLFAAEQEKPVDDQRKGLLTGRHEPQPELNQGGAEDGSDLL